MAPKFLLWKATQNFVLIIKHFDEALGTTEISNMNKFKNILVKFVRQIRRFEFHCLLYTLILTLQVFRIIKRTDRRFKIFLTEFLNPFVLRPKIF